MLQKVLVSTDYITQKLVISVILTIEVLHHHHNHRHCVACPVLDNAIPTSAPGLSILCSMIGSC